MSSIGTLIVTPGNPWGKTIRSAAVLGGINLDVPADYVHWEDNKKQPFLSKFPHGKIPALITTDGLNLFEGTVIARYIASLAPNSNLLGTNKHEAALVDQWIHFCETEIEVHNYHIHFLVDDLVQPYSKPWHTFLLERLQRAFATMEAHLATRTYLVNDRISLADLQLATSILRCVPLTLDAPSRAKYPNIVRHFETIVNQPQLKDIYGAFAYIDVAKQPTPQAKKDKEPKAAVVAAAAAPKADKKPKAKAADDDDDDDEPLVPAEPKAKNPLDDLPKSTFNLEDWKRAYSNKETRGAGGALEWLYQNYDPAGFSLWRVDFKYPAELTQVFMSANQIGGFFNRLEASRKYLFGSLGVLGTANASLIAGALILRGAEFAPVVEVAPDWESYEYRRLDLGNEGDKAFFEAALAWDLEIDGKKWADGKNFK